MRSLRTNHVGQWVIDALAPDKKDSVVKEKQMEALKRMGHTELKLDEYERKVPMQSHFPWDIHHSSDIQARLRMKSSTQTIFP